MNLDQRKVLKFTQHIFFSNNNAISQYLQSSKSQTMGMTSFVETFYSPKGLMFIESLGHNSGFLAENSSERAEKMGCSGSNSADVGKSKGTPSIEP